VKASPLEIIAPNREEHGEAICDQIARISPYHPYFPLLDACRGPYLLDGHYDWAASRIGLADGQIATHFGVWDFRMRIGRTRVRVAGIGGVGTLPAYRTRGWMRRTIDAALQAIRRRGYDLSLLFGIDDFYHRFGYVRAWPWIDVGVRLADLPREAPVHRPRRFTPRQRADLDALYNRRHACLTGTAVRPTYRRPWHPRQWIGYQWGPPDGSPAGYVFLSRRDGKADWACAEAVGDPEEVLRVLAQLGRRWRQTELGFPALHLASPLAVRLRRGTCRVAMAYRRSGGAMVRTVNLPRALSKVVPELARRLSHSPLADWRGGLLVDDGRDRVLLSIDRSAVTIAAPARSRHAIRGGDAVAQLLIGTDDPLETVEAFGVRLAGQARRLLPILFPAQQPQMNSYDTF